MSRHTPFVSQPRCYASLLYVEDLCPGGHQGRGATISWGWWLFCLGYHPRRQDEVGAGLWVTRIQNMLCRTMDISLVVPGWMSGSFIYIHQRLFEYHTSCSRVSRRWPMTAADVISIWRSRRWSRCLRCSDTVKQRGTHVRFKGCEMSDVFQAHYVETVGLKSVVHP